VQVILSVQARRDPTYVYPVVPALAATVATIATGAPPLQVVATNAVPSKEYISFSAIPQPTFAIAAPALLPCTNRGSNRSVNTVDTLQATASSSMASSNEPDVAPVFRGNGRASTMNAGALPATRTLNNLKPLKRSPKAWAR
jgi:hypothetical protein